MTYIEKKDGRFLGCRLLLQNTRSQMKSLL